jgi:hypothetical protein
MCNFDDPPAGSWWILVQNWEASDEPPDDVLLAYGIVTSEADEDWSVTGPESVGRAEPFSLEVGWSVESMAPGDIYYGVVDLGTPMGANDFGTMNIDVLGVARPTIYLPIAYYEKAEPTPEVTEEPTPEGTGEPTPEGTEEPTPEGTEEPDPEPTAEPTTEPVP